MLSTVYNNWSSLTRIWKEKKEGEGGVKEVDVCSTCNIVTHFYYNTVWNLQYAICSQNIDLIVLYL